MNQTNLNTERSYIAHEENWIKSQDDIDNIFFIHKNKNSLEYILKTRTLDILKPILNQKNKWLTVGDYNGFEAAYLMDHNQDVMASDISDCFLIEAKKAGYIDKYQKENVENLSFKEDTFDFVSCRESFHHFPRAYLGLYEMIRVAKKGVYLVEPLDVLTKMPILLLLKNILDSFNPFLINKVWKNRFSWETVGNYVFKISEREIEKIAMGIGLPCVAFKRMNILTNIKENTKKVPVDKKLKRKIFLKIKFLDLLGYLHIIPYNMLCSFIFKEVPSQEIINDLKKMGYTVISLPENPYLK